MVPILKVDNLTKKFSLHGKKEFYGVDHVSFSLYKGEILGLVGESGSGKSTIARLITRLTDATEGTIELDGVDITHCRGKAQRELYKKIQMVFQTPVGSFDPRKTLGNGIGESLKNQGMPAEEIRRKVVSLLTECGLSEDFADRYPHEVSGGQCQRAAIARSLACDPQLIILDEATSALDVTVQKQVMELLKKLHDEKNLSYLFICHNLALVQQFCDRVLVLCDGKIMESGTPDQIIGNPQAEYTKKLINAVFI